MLHHMYHGRDNQVAMNIIGSIVTTHLKLNEEVGFKIPTTRSRNNSVFCGALLGSMRVGLPVWGGALGLLRWLGV